MTHTRLALSLCDKTHHILSASEAIDPIRTYHWYSLFSHVKTTEPTIIKGLIGSDKKVALNAVPSIPIKQIGSCITFKSTLNGEKLMFNLDEFLRLTSLFEYMIVPDTYGVEANQGVFVATDKDTFCAPLAIDARSVSDAVLLKKVADYKAEHVNAKLIVYDVRSYELAMRLSQKGVDYIETSMPLASALTGHVEGKEGLIDLKDNQYRDAHAPIDLNCDCYTCRHHTRAYLHHLMHYTPLLAIKLQAIHNVHLWTKSMAFH